MAWTTDIPIFLADLTPAIQRMEQQRAGDQTVHRSNGNAADAAGLTWKQVSDQTCYGAHSMPLFSPCGRYLSFGCRAHAGYESDRCVLYVHYMSSGITAPLTSAIDMSFESVEWSWPSGTSDEITSVSFYATAQDRGVSKIFQLNCDASTGDGDGDGQLHVHQLRVLKGSRSRCQMRVMRGPAGRQELCFVESSLLSPPELVTCHVHDDAFELFECHYDRLQCGDRVLPNDDAQCLSGTAARMRSVFNPNPQFTNGDLAMPEVIEEHYYRGGGDDVVHLWYLPPPSSTTSPSSCADSSVPLLIVVHGGPQGAILNSWHYRWNMAVFASQGYAVAAVNFHGSTGFGKSFVDSIRGDWGGKPYEDVMRSVDYLCQRHRYLNREAVAALGASYGGYMMNWINGHNDDQVFKCLVNHDGVFSLRSMSLATEELWFTGLFVRERDMNAHHADKFNADEQSGSSVVQAQRGLSSSALYGVPTTSCPTGRRRRCSFRAAETIACVRQRRSRRSQRCSAME